MRGKLIEILNLGSSAIQFADPEDRFPTVLFVMGANGMGKTTTIGKLAHRLRTEGNQTVLMAACDTFRAGAVDQLQLWADRAEVDMYGPSEKAKTPAAVLYGALDKAIAENYDTVLVDTSGRLSNNDALTAELVKMKNVIKKRLSLETDAEGKPIPNQSVPHESLLVLDAAQGRMALDSARVWDKEVGLTGLILTKLDGSARGGSVVAVSRELNLPVKLIGVGEGLDDLRDVSRATLAPSNFELKSHPCDCSLNRKNSLIACLELARLVENPPLQKEQCWLQGLRHSGRNVQIVLRLSKTKRSLWRLAAGHRQVVPRPQIPRRQVKGRTNATRVNDR
jgi:fused signal recognition particle receptor